MSPTMFPTLYNTLKNRPTCFASEMVYLKTGTCKGNNEKKTYSIFNTRRETRLGHFKKHVFDKIIKIFLLSHFRLFFMLRG